MKIEDTVKGNIGMLYEL